ncbi:MAG: thiamine pyrophosphate-dependent enzyme, partial [Pirellulales bacterium]|nr:thiamine pyrophosphate-dependent enzyme [Pirellulales bacterium]
YALEHGPIVLEMDTYRYHGHSMSDPGITYRNRDEVAGVRAARDPVARIKKYLLDLEFATEQEIKTIDMAVKKEVEAAVAAAKAAPEPPMTALYEDIYTDQSKDFFMRGCDMGASNGVYGAPAFTSSKLKTRSMTGVSFPASTARANWPSSATDSI